MFINSMFRDKPLGIRGERVWPQNMVLRGRKMLKISLEGGLVVFVFNTSRNTTWQFERNAFCNF